MSQRGSVVLVTDGEQRSALACVRALGAAGHTVIVASARVPSLSGASRYAARQVHTPSALDDASGFLEAVANIVHDSGVDVLIPITEQSLLAILGARDRFRSVAIPFPSLEQFSRISDKASVLEEARQLGIAVPQQRVLHTPSEAAGLDEHSLQFPVVIKPTRSVADVQGRGLKLGTSHASNWSEMREQLRTYPAVAYPLLLQQRIVGPGIGVFLLVWDDVTIAQFGHRRIREKPPSGGISVYREAIAPDAALVARSRALLDRFHWQGVAMIEYKIHALTETPYLMEINGRFWGSLQLAIDAGVDFPTLLVQCALGEPVGGAHPASAGVQSRWEWGDIEHLLVRLRHSATDLSLPPGSPGRIRALADFLSWHRGDRLEVFRLRDPAPFFLESADWFRPLRVNPAPAGVPSTSGGHSVAATRRTRVLHVIQNLNYGGMERVLADLVTRIDAGRYESHVLCLGYLGKLSEGLERFATLHVAVPTTKLSMLRPSMLARQIAEIAPDVVHTHSGVWYKASLAARLAGVRWLVHTEHGRRDRDSWPHRLFDGLASRRTNAVVAVSERLAQDLPHTLRTPAERVVFIANGIDTDEYQRRGDTGAVRRELGIGPDVPIIGSIGRLEPIKAYDVAIEAFAQLRETRAGREAVLVIAGDGSARNALEALIARLKLRDRVHLLGWRDDVHNLHSAFSLFTISSRSEGTSISLLEAMSAGLPPVVTDVGGNASVLGPALAGQLVPPEDPSALAASWASVLAAPEARRAMGQLSRDRVVTHFSVNAMVRAYQALYDRHAHNVSARAG